jgi:hypothetical protein
VNKCVNRLLAQRALFRVRFEGTCKLDHLVACELEAQQCGAMRDGVATGVA